MKAEKKTNEASVYACLKSGRKPCVQAILSGSADGIEVSGRLDFYDTPPGLLLWICMRGLPSRPAVYGICISGDGGTCADENLCRKLPLLYGKDGKAEGVMLSEQLRRTVWRGKRVSLREMADGRLCTSSEIACGIIKSPVGSEGTTGDTVHSGRVNSF